MGNAAKISHQMPCPSTILQMWTVILSVHGVTALSLILLDLLLCSVGICLRGPRLKMGLFPSRHSNRACGTRGPSLYDFMNIPSSIVYFSLQYIYCPHPFPFKKLFPIWKKLVLVAYNERNSSNSSACFFFQLISSKTFSFLLCLHHSTE